jgi:hypothetical protein
MEKTLLCAAKRRIQPFSCRVQLSTAASDTCRLLDYMSCDSTERGMEQRTRTFGYWKLVAILLCLIGSTVPGLGSAEGCIVAFEGHQPDRTKHVDKAGQRQDVNKHGGKDKAPGHSVQPVTRYFQVTG